MASRSAIHFADCLRHQSTTLCVSAATTLNIHHCQSVIARNGRSRSLGCQRILPPDLCVEVNRGSRAGSRPEHADGHDVNRAMRPYPLTTVGSRVLLQAVVPLTYAPIIPLNKQINQIVPSSASAFAPRQCSLLPPPPPPNLSAPWPRSDCILRSLAPPTSVPFQSSIVHHCHESKLLASSRVGRVIE